MRQEREERLNTNYPLWPDAILKSSDLKVPFTSSLMLKCDEIEATQMLMILQTLFLKELKSLW